MEDLEAQKYAYRYMAIKQGIIETVNKLAKGYEQENGTDRVEDNHGEIRTYKISEEKLYDESIEHACNELLDKAEDLFDIRVYYVIELIMEEEFGRKVCESNPYKKQPPKFKCEMSVMGIPVIKMEG